MPIYSDVIARLDERSVQDTLRSLESQFADSGNRMGDVLTRASSTAMDNFSGGLVQGIRQGVGAFGELGAAAETGMSSAAMGAAAAAASVAGLTIAVVKVGEKLYEVGSQFDEVSDRIAVRTNSIGDQMDDLNNSLSEAFQNSSSSLAQVGDVLTEVSQSLHLTGQPLVAITDQIADLNRMTGDELNIRKFGMAMAQFGIDAGAAGPALDNLYAASAKTGVPLNELVGNLTNAGPAARTLGLNLGELTNLFGKFEEGGINASQAQSALNSAAKVFADAGIPMQTGLADTITQLRGFIDTGNQAAAIDLAGKVFGERGAERFVDLIRQGKLEVADLTTEFGGNLGAIDKQNKATSDLSEKWAELKNRVTDLANTIGGPLFDAVNKVAGIPLDFLNAVLAAPYGGENVSTGTGMVPSQPFTLGGLMPGVDLPAGSAPAGPAGDPGQLSSQFPWLAPSLNLGPAGPGQPQDIAGAIAAAKGGAASAPQIPYPDAYGQPPAPGETVAQWTQRMAVMDAQHDIATKQAALTQLQSADTVDQNAVIKARNDVISAQMRLTQLENQQVKAAQSAQAQVPYPTGYGAAPRPGETSQQYSAEQAVYEAQHRSAEARARLAQVEQTATATAEDLIKARNDLTKAEVAEHQAQLRLTESASKATENLGQIGAQIDADFGFSKGLPGIVENITRMIASMAAAPAIGALAGGQIAMGYKPGDAGSGLMGILAAQGVFGDQYTATAASSSPLIPPFNPDVTVPAAMSAPGFGSPAAISGESARAFAHRAMMPFWQAQGFQVGDHAADKYGEHQNGALDVMVPSLAQGGRVLQEALSDPNVYGAIFNNQTYGYGHGATPKDYSGGHTGDPSQDHTNHVHILYRPGGADNINPGGTGPMGAGSVMLGGQSLPLPLPVTIVGGAMPGVAATDVATPAAAVPSPAPGSATVPSMPGRPSAGASSAGGGIASALFPGLSAPSTSTPASTPAAPGSASGSDGGGAGTASSFFPGLAGPPQAGGPGLDFPGVGGGPEGGSTLIGGLAPPVGTGAGFSGIGGGIAGAAMGAASMGAGLAAAGAGGPGAAAGMQMGIQLLNRAVAYGGQAMGIAASGVIETLLPFGSSELAQNNWVTKILGGVVGARPVMPNTAGKKTPEGLTPDQAAQANGGPTPAQVAGNPTAGGQGGAAGGQTVNNNVTVNNQRPTEDGTGRDVTWHLGQMYQGPGQ